MEEIAIRIYETTEGSCVTSEKKNETRRDGVRVRSELSPNAATRMESDTSEDEP